MSKGRHRKQTPHNRGAMIAAVGVIGTTAGMMLSASPASASTPAPTQVSDATIASVGMNAGLSGCSGAPLGTWVAVALAESGGNPTSHNSNGEDSRGLWQINMRAHASWVGDRDLYDPATNAWAAKHVCDIQGIDAWSTYTNGAYRQYLARGDAAAATSGSAAGSAAGSVSANPASPPTAQPSGPTSGTDGVPVPSAPHEGWWGHWSGHRQESP